MPGLEGLEKDENVLSKADQFVWLKTYDAKLAKEFNVQNSGEVVVVDPDGDKIAQGLTKAFSMVLDQALKVCSRRSINWGGDLDAAIKSARGTHKIVLAAWADDKRYSVDTLANLEEKTIAKYHDKFVFVKLDLKRDDPVVKEWRINLAPTLIAIDPDKFEPGKQLDRISGPESERSLKEFVQKAVRSFGRK